MLMSDLEQAMGQVNDRLDLAAFILRLRADLLSDPDVWENPTLERFLEALSAWTQDMDGYFENRGEVTPSEPSWRLVADMLLAARMYE
jgi:hypothetical protein